MKTEYVLHVKGGDEEIRTLIRILQQEIPAFADPPKVRSDGFRGHRTHILRFSVAADAAPDAKQIDEWLRSLYMLRVEACISQTD